MCEGGGKSRALPEISECSGGRGFGSRAGPEVPDWSRGAERRETNGDGNTRVAPRDAAERAGNTRSAEEDERRSGELINGSERFPSGGGNCRRKGGGAKNPSRPHPPGGAPHTPRGFSRLFLCPRRSRPAPFPACPARYLSGREGTQRPFCSGSGRRTLVLGWFESWP